MDSSMTAVMKGVAEALRMDGENRLEEAYTKYIECVLRITTKLLQDVRSSAGRQVTIDKEVIKSVQLGQQCMDRISVLISQLGKSTYPKEDKKLPLKPPDGNQVLSPTGNVSSGSFKPSHSYSFDSKPRGFSDPIPPMPDNPTTVTYKKQKNLTPMELAYKQNQMLMTAYRARIAKLNAKCATSLSLTIQRKIAENLAIAKAQEDALAKKMLERQLRLEEQAIKKFGSSDKEHKDMYKRVMEYEQDSEWFIGLRKELEDNPTDSAVIEKVIQAVLRCVDHPLTEKLKSYQYRVYTRLYPLVASKTDTVNQVKVPLDSELWPTFDSPISESESNSSEKCENENFKTIIVKGKESESIEEQTIHSTEDVSKLEHSDVIDEVGDVETEERYPSISDIEDEAGHVLDDRFHDWEGQSQIHRDEKRGLLTDVSESESDNVIKEVVENLEVHDDDNPKEEISEQSMETISQDAKDNLKEAIKKGKKLQTQLTIENIKTEKLCYKVSEDYENYTLENMDDLFDNESEDEGHDVPQVQDSSVECKVERSNSSKSINSDSDSTNTDSSYLDSNMNSDKNFLNLASATKTEISSSDTTNKGSTNDLDKINVMKNEAYLRHLKGISEDVLNYLDRLMTLFIGAYEQLDTPEGRDNCYSLLEEPFFRPLWECLLSLFRLANRSKEISVAYVMTRKQCSSPGDFGVIKKLQLEDQDHEDGCDFAYKPVVHELQSLIHHSTLLGKLECIVKASRLICQCIEDYYRKPVDGQKRKTPSIGADDLLPILSYVIVKTGLPQIVSECHIMEEFIHEGYIMGEEGYCLTSMQTALGYLVSLGSKKL